MGEDQGMTPIEDLSDRAWVAFRRRLADQCAAMVDDDHLVIELEQAVDDDQLFGAAPYLQMVAWGEGAIRAEVCSNEFLDDRFRLGSAQELRLRELGWELPTHGRDDEPDHGSPHWWTDVEVRQADQLAVMCVGALREVLGCAHPAFLVLGGFDEPPPVEPAPVVPAQAEPDDRDAVYPSDREELCDLVDRAVAPIVGEPVHHDSDGDVPIRLGESVLYLRVWEEEPIVELYAELVNGIVDPTGAAREVAVLNRDLVYGTVILIDDRVVLRHRLSGAPFVASELRRVAGRVSSDLDTRAADLAARVGGRRFLEAVAEPEVGEPATALHPSVAVLRELLAAGEADPRIVAALFEGDMGEITALVEELRADTGAAPGADALVDALRGALRFLAVRKSRAMWDRPRRAVTRVRPSDQPSLLTPREVGEQSLDLGVE